MERRDQERKLKNDNENRNGPAKKTVSIKDRADALKYMREIYYNECGREAPESYEINHIETALKSIKEARTAYFSMFEGPAPKLWSAKRIQEAMEDAEKRRVIEQPLQDIRARYASLEQITSEQRAKLIKHDKNGNWQYQEDSTKNPLQQLESMNRYYGKKLKDLLYSLEVKRMQKANSKQAARIERLGGDIPPVITKNNADELSTLRLINKQQGERISELLGAQ